MDIDVVEVLARFGDTIVDVAHVGAADAYRIGTAPGVNLAVPGLTRFPIVEGRTIRCPAGMRAEERGNTTVLRSGALAIEITRARLPGHAVPRRRVELRTPLFIVASLLVHVAIWMIAVTLEPFEQLPRHKPRPYRLVRIPDAVEKPVPTPPPPKPEVRPPEQPEQAARVARGRISRREQIGVPPDRARMSELVGAPIAAPAERAESHDMGAAVAAAVARATQVDVAKYADSITPENNYNPDDLESSGFGGHLRLGPGETIKSGAYATLNHDVKQCAKSDPQCRLTGPTKSPYVRSFLLAHMDEIYDCYAEHASEPGTIVLEFTIKGDGSVQNARGSGLGETGECAARIVAEIQFRAQWPRSDSAEYDTHVRWPIRFN